MKNNLILLSLIFILFSCNSVKKNSATEFYKTILPDFIMSSAPSGLDVPGRVYRIDTMTNEKNLVEFLPIVPYEASIGIPMYEIGSNFKGNFLISLLSLNDKVTAEYYLEKTKDYRFTVILKEPKKQEISDNQYALYIDELEKRINENIVKLRLKNNKFFMIRETVSSKEIFINNSRKRNFIDSIDIPVIKKIVSVNTQLSWTDSIKSEIKATFDKPVHVFYKPIIIDLKFNDGPVEIIFRNPTPEEVELIKKAL